MIDVSMREHDCIDLGDVDRQAQILRVRLTAVTLEQPAVQHDALAADLDDVTRAGDLSRRAGERDLHTFTRMRDSKRAPECDTAFLSCKGQSCAPPLLATFCPND